MKVDGILGAVIGLFVGAAGGATVGYLISEKKFMTKLNEELDKLPPLTPPPEKKEEENKEEEKKEDPAKAMMEDFAAIYKDALDKAVAELEEERRNHKNSPYDEDDKVDYSSYSEAKKEKPKPDPVTERRNMRSGDKPYVITEEEFDNTCPEFFKMGKVVYYVDSHELVDDEADTILDIDSTVGRENVVNFPESGCIAVRNEAIATDYLITFVDGSYPYMY